MKHETLQALNFFLMVRYTKPKTMPCLTELFFLLVAKSFFDSLNIIPSVQFYLQRTVNTGDDAARGDTAKSLLEQLAVLFARQHWMMSQEMEERGLAENVTYTRAHSNMWRKYERDPSSSLSSTNRLLLLIDYENGKTLLKL